MQTPALTSFKLSRPCNSVRTVLMLLIAMGIISVVINNYKATNISNYKSTNVSIYETINKCFTDTVKTTTYLQYNTLNIAFTIDGNLQHISEYFALIESHISGWYGKIFTRIFVLTNSSNVYIGNLFVNKTKIITFTGTHQQKLKYIKMNFFADILMWINNLNINITEKSCNVYNLIGSDEWIEHKTMQSHNFTRYMLGDMVKFRKYRRQRRGYRKHKRYFPQSIAVEYMEKINETVEYEDLNLLLQVISGRKQLYPSKNTLVIHLRTGDVFDQTCKWTVKSKKSQDQKQMSQLLYDPISVFNKLKPKFTKNNISDIVLVTGFHVKMKHINSVEYIIKIKQWFYENNFSVSFRINEDPDQDFMFMCNSKFFIQSAGGFSSLIAQIVSKRNGTVFNTGWTWFHAKPQDEIQNCLDKIKSQPNDVHGFGYYP